jgi:S-adenosylmethionine decarboxylase
MKGLHILAELHDCQAGSALMHEAAVLRDVCVAACAGAGLTGVAEAFHEFPGGGATGVVVLAESHLAVHTWPEISAVTLDIYVCNYSQDNRAAAVAAYAALSAAFLPTRVIRRDIQRGDVGAA